MGPGRAGMGGRTRSWALYPLWVIAMSGPGITREATISDACARQRHRYTGGRRNRWGRMPSAWRGVPRAFLVVAWAKLFAPGWGRRGVPATGCDIGLVLLRETLWESGRGVSAGSGRDAISQARHRPRAIPTPPAWHASFHWQKGVLHFLPCPNTSGARKGARAPWVHGAVGSQGGNVSTGGGRCPRSGALAIRRPDRIPNFAASVAALAYPSAWRVRQGVARAQVYRAPHRRAAEAATVGRFVRPRPHTCTCVPTAGSPAWGASAGGCGPSGMPR